MKLDSKAITNFVPLIPIIRSLNDAVILKLVVGIASFFHREVIPITKYVGKWLWALERSSVGTSSAVPVKGKPRPLEVTYLMDRILQMWNSTSRPRWSREALFPHTNIFGHG